MFLGRALRFVAAAVVVLQPAAGWSWPSARPDLVVRVAMSAELADAIDAAIASLSPNQAFAVRLALVDARLAVAAELAGKGDVPGAADQVSAAHEGAAAIDVPQRFRSALAELSAQIAGLDPASVDGARAAVAALQDPAFLSGGDATIMRLRAIELLLRIASSVYAEAVAPDATMLSLEDLRLARGLILSASGLYASIERDLDNRVQSITAGMTNVLRMIDRDLQADPAGNLLTPEAASGMIAFFLGYSANF